MKQKQQEFTVTSAALLALAFLFVMTATEGPYWGEADVEDSIVMIQVKEQGQSESDTLTGMAMVRRQIHSLYKEGQKIPVTVCEETEYVVSNGKKVPKAEACKEVYVETKAEQQEEPYKKNR